MQERTIADLQTQIADGVRAKFLDGAAADARRDKLGMLLQEENGPTMALWRKIINVVGLSVLPMIKFV